MCTETGVHARTATARHLPCLVRDGIWYSACHTYPASLYRRPQTQVYLYYIGPFPATTEVEDDQWRLGSGLILRPYSLWFLKDEHTRYTPFSPHGFTS